MAVHRPKAWDELCDKIAAAPKCCMKDDGKPKGWYAVGSWQVSGFPNPLQIVREPFFVHSDLATAEKVIAAKIRECAIKAGFPESGRWTILVTGIEQQEE